MSQRTTGKNVLLVNQTFNHKETAGIRMSKFAKYLPQYGWSPHLLHWAHRNNSTAVSDELSEHIKSVTHIDSTTDLDLISNNPYLSQLNHSYEIRKGVQNAVRTHDIDAVVQSCPPFLPLINMRYITNEIDVPYIVDFRDSWTIRYRNDQQNITSLVMNKLRNMIEKCIFDYSDVVIMNTPRMERMYSKLYPESTNKLVTIPNGFDADLVNSTPETDSNQFQIIYPGRYRSEVAAFLEGFHEFTKRGYDVQFVYYGRSNSAFDETVRQLSLEEYIDFRGYQDRDIVFSAIARSNIGLAVTRGDDPTQVPTKIYDYIGCDIPILCVDDAGGAVREILENFPNAYVVTPEETEEMAFIIEKIYKKEILELGNSKATEQYNRSNLTRKLSKILNSVSIK